MSDRCTCSGCGDTYGISWGDTGSKCPECSHYGPPKDRIKKLTKENTNLKKRVKELEEKYEPKHIGENI